LTFQTLDPQGATAGQAHTAWLAGRAAHATRVARTAAIAHNRAVGAGCHGGWSMRLVCWGLVVTFTVALSGLAAAQDARVQQGAKVYEAQKCGMCHSIAGKGNKKFPLDGVGRTLAESQIREWVVDPKAAAEKAKSTAKPPMKAYASLPAADLDALVAYVASLK
jgi:mono/diheme cytochrome c family protein